MTTKMAIHRLSYILFLRKVITEEDYNEVVKELNEK